MTDGVPPAWVPPAGRAVHQDGPGGLEPRPTEALVGFEVVALRPLVPGHDEEVVLLLGHVGHGADRPVEPVLVEVGPGALEDGGPVRAPGGVVPADHHRGEALVLLGRWPPHLLLHRGPVVDDALAPGAVHRGEHLVAGDRHEADAGVHAVVLGSAGRRAPALDEAQVEVGDAELLRLVAPDLERPPGIGQLLDPVDEHQRPAVDGDVAGVLERLGEVADVGQVVLGAVLLGDEDGAGHGVPVPGPLLVGPAQGEREVGGSGLEDLLEGALEELLPVEPVVVVDEPRDPVVAGQLGLGLTYLGQAQVVVAELAGHVRLVVARIQGLGLGHVGPLGEPLAPPLVVLGDRVVLGEVEGERLRGVLSGARRVLSRWSPPRLPWTDSRAGRKGAPQGVWSAPAPGVARRAAPPRGRGAGDGRFDILPRPGETRSPVTECGPIRSGLR